MAWRYNLPKCPVSPADRGEFMKPPSTSKGQTEASQAQHFDLPKGQPARFTYNGERRVCQCTDCRRLAARPQPQHADGRGAVIDPAVITVPFNPCLAKLRPGEPFFVLLGRDKQAPNAVMTWANDREAAEGKSAWTDQAREVYYAMVNYRAALQQSDGPAK